MQPIDVYGALVKQQHALNETIAPLEKTSQASAAHSVGTQLIYNGVLYDVTTNIAVGDTLTVGTNISVADDITTQISSVNTALTNEVTTRATLGTHNLFNYNTTYDFNSMTVTDGVFTSNNTDTRTSLRLRADAFDSNGDSISQIISDVVITETGTYSYNATLTSDVAYIYFRHNGATRNLGFKIPWTTAGNYVLSFTLTGVDVTTSGGFVVEDIMLRLASDADSTYQPYSMTNQELTDVSNTIDSETISNSYGYVKFYKQNKIVWGVIYMNSATYSSGDSICTIPNDYIPVTDCVCLDMAQNRMFSVSATNKTITVNHSYSSANIRSTFNWLTS